MEQKLISNLWFDNNAVEAAEFYISVFKGDGRIVHVANYTESAPGPTGEPMVVEWEMCGQRYVGINGGPIFKPSEAFSIQINCDTQEEIDGYWDAIVSNGGGEGPGGWGKDKIGGSGEIPPQGMGKLFARPGKEKGGGAREGRPGRGQ